MRPAPIPNEVVWEGGKRVVFSAPNGDLLDDTIRPVEAIVDPATTERPHLVSVRCVLEEGDLVKLAEGGHVWITFWGGLPPFSTTVTGPGE